MSGPTTSPASTTTFVQGRPIAAAGGVVVAVQAIMAALWAVVGDAGLMPWLTPGSQGLITFAVTAVVTTIAAIWAQALSTPTAAPVLQVDTPIRVVDAGGATLGHAATPTPADPDA